MLFEMRRLSKMLKYFLCDMILNGQYERKFDCFPENTELYRWLGITSLGYKALIRHLEIYAEKLKSLGLKEELKQKEAAAKDLRCWEKEVERLEAMCFGKGDRERENEEESSYFKGPGCE